MYRANLCEGNYRGIKRHIYLYRCVICLLRRCLGRSRAERIGQHNHSRSTIGHDNDSCPGSFR